MKLISPLFLGCSYWPVAEIENMRMVHHCQSINVCFTTYSKPILWKGKEKWEISGGEVPSLIHRNSIDLARLCLLDCACYETSPMWKISPLFLGTFWIRDSFTLGCALGEQITYALIAFKKTTTYLITVESFYDKYKLWHINITKG